eukprot:TRINITY_DN644_c0_g3_i3.p1 TRINITY_DN644_c0_g3~~TRINITY_DN644_c0_g3_i3.p1  ORF type:complete len:987 (-),score=141.26 TRINITY_DN644_c0_g3_i3:189-3149(-)
MVTKRGDLITQQVKQKCEVECGSLLANEFKNVMDWGTRCPTELPGIRRLTFDETRGWRSCLSQIFNGNSAKTVLPCSSDSDCFDSFRNISYSCDLINHQCLSNYTQLLYSFVSCLDERLSGAIKALLSVEPQISLIEALFSQTEKMCVLEQGLNLTISPRFYPNRQCVGTDTDACVILGVKLLSRWSNEIPYSCLFRQPCSNPSSLVYSTLPSVSCGQSVCRIVNLNGECTSSQCAACFGSHTVCHSVESITGRNITSKTECESLLLCVLPLGNMLLVSSPAECEKLGQCVSPSYQGSERGYTPRSVSCLGSACINPAQCEQVGGRCSVEDVFEEFQNASQLCVTKHRTPFNLLTCSSPYKGYPRGCVSNLTSTSCEMVIEKKVFSEASCKELGFGCRISFLNELYGSDTIMSMQSSNECSCSQGKPGVLEYFWPWEKGQWKNGKIITLQWIEETNFTPTIMKEVTSFNSLEKLVNSAIVQWNNFWVLSQKDCVNYPVLNVLSDFFCACNDDGLSVCQNGFSNILALTLICPSEIRVLNLGYSELTFDTSSVLNSESCLNLTVDQELSNKWLPRGKAAVSTSFRYQNKYSNSEIVYNQKGVVVGSVTSLPGFRVIATGVLDHFEFCSAKPELTPEYPLPLFAVVIEEKLVVLEDLEIWEVTKNVTQICAMITSELIMYSIAHSEVSLFLVGVSEDWKGQNSDISDKEYGLFITATVLFWALFILTFSFGLSTHSFWANLIAKEDFSVFVIICEVSVFALFRAVYFLLLAKQSDMSTTAQNVLLEFPTFVYFSLVLEQIFLFQFQTEKQKKKFVSLLTTLCLLVVFCIVIILLQFIKNDDSQTTCRGRIVTDSSGISRTDQLRIVYKSTIGFFAFATAFALVGFGSRALKQMKEFRLKNQHVLQGLEAYELPVLIKTVVISLSLAANCLGFIIYYVLDESTPYFVFFLFGTEIVPLLVLVWVFRKETSLKFGKVGHGTSTGPSTVDL